MLCNKAVDLFKFYFLKYIIDASFAFYNYTNYYLDIILVIEIVNIDLIIENI